MARKTISEKRRSRKEIPETLGFSLDITQRLLEESLKNPIALIQRVKAGFSYKAFENLRSELDVSKKDLADLLNISVKTLSRRKEEGRLNSDESDRILRVLRIFALTLDLFEGDRSEALHWLVTPRPALDNQSPWNLAKTEVGAREVEALILRLEHGVFS